MESKTKRLKSSDVAESSESSLLMRQSQDQSEAPDERKAIHSLVEERNDAVLNINSLLDDVLIMIFRYLDLKTRCRAGGVCKKWHQVAREETFWRKVTADLHYKRRLSLLPRAAFRFIAMAPSYVTHLKINFTNSEYIHRKDRWRSSFISFTDFSKELRENFPNLQVLFLHQVRFDACGENLDLCTRMPSSTRELIIHHSEFISCRRLRELDTAIPKIETLDLSFCGNVFIRPASFLLMLHLKVLRLAGCKIDDYFYFESPDGDLTQDLSMTNNDYYFACVVRVLCRQLKVLDLESTWISSTTFREICTCVHLTQLYVCSTSIKGSDIMLEDQGTVFPSLKTICFVNCEVTSNGINSFITSCPSLKNVYVGGNKIDYADCKSDIVHVLSNFKLCRHYTEVDYMGK